MEMSAFAPVERPVSCIGGFALENSKVVAAVELGKAKDQE